MEETRNVSINIRVKPSIKAAEKRAAENRSLTAYLEWLILQDSKRKVTRC